MHASTLRRRATWLLLAQIVALVGCRSSSNPKSALTLRRQSLEWRERTTRRFPTNDEKQILGATAGVLQDLGFTLESSESDLGLVVASKDRSAVEAGQVAAKVFLLILTRRDRPIDKNQRFRASIVTRPVPDGVAVRATFQRIVWDDRGKISKLEPIEDAQLYQKFFEQLSQAVFLEAEHI